MQTKINKPGLAALALGHLVVDMQTSSLAVIIPMLYITFKLDYAAAALIITLNSLTSSVSQPLFGLVSDRKPLPWLLPLGCLVAAGGMVLVLFAPDYWLVLLLVMVSGLGSAAYHPEGSRNANYVSGPNKSTGMSVFFVGGNLGYALGPILITALLAIGGRGAALGMLVPGLIGFTVLWQFLPLYKQYALNRPPRPTRRSAAAQPDGRSVFGSLSVLLSIISIRSMLQTGLITFIPLYFASLGANNKEYAAFLLSVFVLAGAVGTLSGGPLADRFGRKPVMIASLSLVGPLLLVFLNSGGPVQVISLGIAGAALISASTLTVVMAQETLPNSIGLASGLTLGLGFGAGGLGAAGLGKFADVFGIGQAMLVLVVLPVPVILLSLLLPSQKPGKESTPDQAVVPPTRSAEPQRV